MSSNARDQPRAFQQKTSNTTRTSPQQESQPTEPPPPISYARLGYLLAVARAEAFDGEFSDEAREELAEEWSIMVDEAFIRFDSSLCCGNCGRRHKCDEIGVFLSDLRQAMEGLEVEDINENLVKGFQVDFEKIRIIYLEGIRDTICSEEA